MRFPASGVQCERDFEAYDVCNCGEPEYRLNGLLTVPEITALDTHGSWIRIPPELNVPLTDRVRRLIDTEPFRRLAKISQVGLVALVYPAALHTRFEHSLGVYRLALLTLKRLAHDPQFAATVSKRDAELLIVAALLHDLGHWPFCHAIEDIRLPGVPNHESAAAELLQCDEMAELLQNDWNLLPDEVIRLLNGETDLAGTPRTSSVKLLASILSGPIDIDKMDYLFRDSLHAGVPYGRNVDQGRLIGSFCVNESGDALAITEKGKTAAELMVFARYVMFSEVYWHHAVRAATSMFQRLFFELFSRYSGFNTAAFFHSTEAEGIEQLRQLSKGTEIEPLAEGLFGPRRALYKRVAQFSIMEEPELYRQLARRPYPELCGVADRLAELLGLPYCSLLLDAPPVEKEVEIKIDVHYAKEDRYRPLENVSPVVRVMAREQFDDYVKRVRVFAPPNIAERLKDVTLTTILRDHHRPSP